MFDGITPKVTMKELAYYLALPYTIELIREEDATWFARVVELPGCLSAGDSAEDAAGMIQDAMAGWIELALEDGRSIPEPKPREEYSGKFVVRVPRSLHRDLVEAAAKEQVSLNQFIATELARAVGRPAPQPATVGRYQPASLKATGVEGHVFHDSGAADYAVTESTGAPQDSA